MLTYVKHHLFTVLNMVFASFLLYKQENIEI